MLKRKREFAIKERQDEAKRRRIENRTMMIRRPLRGMPEIKFFDKRDTINTGLTWTFEHIANMVQGTTGTSRVGAKIRILSIDVRGIVRLPTQTGAVNPISGDLFRVCIVQDTQSNGGIVAGLDVFSVNAITEFQNYTTNTRFIRLKDKMSKPVSSNNFVAATGSSIEFSDINLHVKKNIDVEFISNTGDYQQVGKNGIWLAVVACSGIADFDYTSRIRFVDY